MERQIILLSHVATGAHGNAIMLQGSCPQAFRVFFIAVRGYLHSQANHVAIQHKLYVSITHHASCVRKMVQYV